MSGVNTDVVALKSDVGLDEEAVAIRRNISGQILKGSDELYRAALSLRKSNGQKIRGLLTSPGSEWRGIIVIGAGFGRTIRHSNALAITAAHHGYASVRFDPTNHVGDSDGEILNVTASQAADDMLFVCEFIRKMGWGRLLFVVAASLFARASIMTFRRGLPVDGVVLSLPVVDYEKTLKIITGEDIVALFRANEIGLDETIDILSHRLSARFLQDLDNNCADLEATKLDLREATMPLAMVVAEGDEWVSVDDVVTVLEAECRPNRKLYVLENTTHDSYSFGFIRAVTQATIQAIAEMSGDSLSQEYEVTFAKLANVVNIEKKVLNYAREIWKYEE